MDRSSEVPSLECMLEGAACSQRSRQAQPELVEEEGVLHRSHLGVGEHHTGPGVVVPAVRHKVVLGHKAVHIVAEVVVHNEAVAVAVHRGFVVLVEMAAVHMVAVAGRIVQVVPARVVGIADKVNAEGVPARAAPVMAVA